jgi:hypothetical protein
MLSDQCCVVPHDRLEATSTKFAKNPADIPSHSRVLLQSVGKSKSNIKVITVVLSKYVPAKSTTFNLYLFKMLYALAVARYLIPPIELPHDDSKAEDNDIIQF